MPPPLIPTEQSQEPLDALPVLTGWVRGTLVGITLGLLVVFGIALSLDPYEKVRPDYLATFAWSPDASFPGNVPWGALVLSSQEEGSFPDSPRVPRQMETHTKLGLPPCAFKDTVGLPCPSCGMTTSFALLVRGDVWNSLRANAAGTLLALFCLALIPWNLASIFWERPVFILSLERALIRIVVGFLALILIRWVIVLGLAWLEI